jgi:WD40 repeat protein
MSADTPTGRRRSFLPLIVGGVLFVAAAGFLGWRLTRGDELATLRGHDGPVRAVVFSPDGTTIASAGDDGMVCIWDAATYKEGFPPIAHGPKVRAVAFGPGSLLVSAGDGMGVFLSDWRASARPDMPAMLEGTVKVVECLALTADGKTVAAAGVDGMVYLWAIADRSLLRKLQGHTKHVHGLAFLPDNRTLLSAGEDGVIRVWNWPAGTTEATIDVGRHHVHGLAVSADGAMLAAAVGGTGLRRWSLPDRRELPQIEGAGMARGVAFSPDGKTLATVHEDGTVKLWDAATGDNRAVLKGHVKVVLGVAFAPDGRTLATAGGDGTVKVWRNADKR